MALRPRLATGSPLQLSEAIDEQQSLAMVSLV
jgi:hypothetical protein